MDAPLDEQSSKVAADLKVQAMMFDMDVDWELATLVPKITHIVPIWLARWKDKEKNSDRQPQDYEGGEDDRH